MNREQLLHWVEDNPRLIQDTLIRMVEAPIENNDKSFSKALDGEQIVRDILENTNRLLKLNNVVTEGDLLMASYDRGDEVDPEDIPPQLSEADRAKARTEDNG